MSTNNTQRKHSFLSRRLEWPVPLTMTHEGLPLSNGTFGALLWGEGNHLRITINRADYWDHRGGMDFPEEATYANLRAWLEAGDEARLREVFEKASRGAPGAPPRPTRLPMGRIDLRFAGNFCFVSGGLDIAHGRAEVELADHSGVAKLRAIIFPAEQVLALWVDAAGYEAPEVLLVPPDSDEVLEYFHRYGFPESRRFDEDSFRGWVQERPGEPAMCVGCLSWRSGGATEIFVTSLYAPTPEQAIEKARSLLKSAAATGYDSLAAATARWWKGWWDRTAALSLPDQDIELLYYLGLYKLAGLTPPGSPAATLQGPWIEEYRMPPWQGDYHFNVNVQECYWPAYASNHLETLEPLAALINSWRLKLREYARRFAGVEDGFLLPHAVDDRCTCMGGFWTGSIDHGSTAWTAQLFWLHYLYSGDVEFLRENAYPLMKGALRVYEVMLDETEDGWRLPVSVSPEFGGSGMDAWGANASYQLAAIHMLARALIRASEVLGIDAEDRERWRDIDERLPEAATDSDGLQIYLWEGQPLSESHRHHSHLAGIYPFDTLDYGPGGPQEALVRNSLRHLTDKGMGRWTGWCMPWASILFARQDNGGMAELLLAAYRRAFMNRGYASSHDSQFPGLTVMDGRPTIMQIEACLGAAAAVLEMLAHTRAGVLHVFPAVPDAWSEAAFSGLRAEGAFLVDAERRDGCCVGVRVESLQGALLRLANPWGRAAVRVESDGKTQVIEGPVLDLPTRAGQILLVHPA